MNESFLKDTREEHLTRETEMVHSEQVLCSSEIVQRMEWV